jgi:hypothetical protein
MSARVRRTGGAEYRVLIGFNWPDGAGGEHRAEKGQVRTDIPADIIAGLIDQGAIEAADLSGAPDDAAPEV